MSGCAAPAGHAAPSGPQFATVDAIHAYFRTSGKTVVTFTGYSGAGYEDPAAMLAVALWQLDRYPPASTIVNIGATPDGIGALHEVARRRGYTTTGIVSTRSTGPCGLHVICFK